MPRENVFIAMYASLDFYGRPPIVEVDSEDADKFWIRFGTTSIGCDYDFIARLASECEAAIREKWENTRPDTTDPDGDFSDLAQLAEGDAPSE